MAVVTATPSRPVSLGMQGLVVDLFFNKFRGSLRLFHCAETSNPSRADQGLLF